MGQFCDLDAVPVLPDLPYGSLRSWPSDVGFVPCASLAGPVRVGSAYFQRTTQVRPALSRPFVPSYGIERQVLVDHLVVLIRAALFSWACQQ